MILNEGIDSGINGNKSKGKVNKYFPEDSDDDNWIK